MTETTNNISFNVETSRILQILSTEIYDSPNALLRENVQNAYDAILMRCEKQSIDINDRKISIRLIGNTLSIEDDGIGMNEEVLRNNYWKAGSSGKKTDLAKKSGVIGTFGIGAMANFGVCSKLVVETKHVDSDVTLVSTAIRDNLKISEECIKLEKVEIEGRGPGTKIVAELDETNSLNEQVIIQYLNPYVEYLPVAVEVNERNISQRQYEANFQGNIGKESLVENKPFGNSNYSGKISIAVNANGLASTRVSDILFNGNPLKGEIFLVQNGNRVMGLRNCFGLAPVPVSSHYQLGGIINLQILIPTAGREALSRESIQHVSNLLNLIEMEISTAISNTSHADMNTNFQQHILSTGKLNLAKKVTINVLPSERNIPLSGVEEFEKEKQMYYYTARDQTKIQTFSNEQTNLLHISQVNPRRKIQLGYLQRFLNVPQVPNNVMITDVPASQLAIDEAMLLLKIKSILDEDYLMFDTEVGLAQMSDGVLINVEKKENVVSIKIERSSPAIKSVLECYRTAKDVFVGFVKDFVREHLYQHIRNYVPSSTKEGRDALYNRLKKNKELYRLEEKDYGDIESYLADFIGGKKNLGAIMATTRHRAATQRQKVSSQNVASVETEMPDIIGNDSKNDANIEERQELVASPPIIRPKLQKSIKVLTVSEKHKKLNSFKMFLALSDKLFKKEGEFLRYPHTTKIIWATHRVIFIFTDETNTLSLYYDIDLKEPLSHESTGGGAFPTTTIYTEDRIFVPIPEQLEDAFQIQNEPKEFLVRFDTIP